MSEGWFYRDGDAEQGPLTDADFAQRVDEGVVKADTLVRLGVEGAWIPARKAAPMAFPASPPQPAKAAAWTDVAPRPLRRLSARALDYLVVGGAIWALAAAIVRAAAPDWAASFSDLDRWLQAGLRTIAVLAVLVPVHAILTGLTGFTVGKWVFGIRILRKGRPVGLGAALRREVMVWWRGLAAGLPIICLVTAYSALRRLESDGRAPWDKALDLTAVQREEGMISDAVMALAGAALAIIWLMTEVARNFS